MDLKSFSVDQTRGFLSSFIVPGKATESKDVEGTNLYKYLLASSQEFKRINDMFVLFLKDINPQDTLNFITEWESALGIPDKCIPLSVIVGAQLPADVPFQLADTDIDGRRQNILLKMASLSVQTEQEFIDLGEKLGFSISFGTEGEIYLPLEVPFSVYNLEGEKYIWIVKGNFSSNEFNAEIFKCLVKALIPSYYDVVFIDK